MNLKHPCLLAGLVAALFMSVSIWSGCGSGSQAEVSNQRIPNVPPSTRGTAGEQPMPGPGKKKGSPFAKDAGDAKPPGVR